MAVGGDQLASETLDASRHSLGCLLESLLIPTTHDLTFREVVTRCLYKNRRDAQHHLDNHKDLEFLRGHISQEESYLQEDTPEQDVPEGDDSLNQGAEAVRSPKSRTNDAPSGGATAPVSDTSPGEDAAMEVDEGTIIMPPTSPVSREDDNLLNENEAVGVEAGLAHLSLVS